MSDLDIEEDLAKRRLDRRVLSRIVALAVPVWHWLAAMAGVQLVLVASIFLRPWFIGETIDHGVVRSADGWYADWWLITLMSSGLAIAWLARFGLAGVSQWCAGRAATQVLNDMRLHVFAHVQRLSVSYFDRTRAGRIISRVDRDVDALEPVIVNGPPEVLSMLLRIVGAVIMLAWYDPKFVLVLAVPVLLLGGGMLAFQRLGTRLWARAAEHKSRMTAHLVETVSGVAVIQGATAEVGNAQRFKTLLTALDRSSIAGAWGWGWFAPFSAVLWACGLAGVVWIGIHDVAAGTMSTGDLTQCLFYVILFLGPIQELGDLFEKAATAIASAQRIFLLLDTPSGEQRGGADPGRVRGDIVFDHVQFGYLPARPVLHDLSFHITAGQRVAVVGPTGCGKSTLVQLINRFYVPQSGRILIDGHLLSDLDSRALRQQVGVVLQDNALFSGTVLDNLRIAAPTASDERLIDAARVLGVDDVLLRLPHGLRSEVGPGGARLSHGQRQIICLVRAFIADPAILVLDEATSAVDMLTELRIRRALRRLCAGRTSIIIAHRLATVEDCDRVLVIEAGRIVEDGSPNVLRHGTGLFARLHAAGGVLGDEPATTAR